MHRKEHMHTHARIHMRTQHTRTHWMYPKNPTTLTSPRSMNAPVMVALDGETDPLEVCCVGVCIKKALLLV